MPCVMPDVVPSDQRSLSALVTPVDLKITTRKDPAKPYVGLENIPSRGAHLSGWAPASSSISTNSMFLAGDILFGKLRPNLRKCVVAPFDGYCSTDILVLRVNEGIDQSFAGKMFRTECVGAAAEMTSVGTKMPRTSWKHLGELRVFCPSLREQGKIAHILDTLDTAIQQSEVIAAKLKSIKQGLLHDLLTRGIDANGELRPLYSGAPHRYKPSPLGPIPKEWELGRLEDWLVGKPKNGYSPREAPESTGVYMLGLGCLTTDGFFPVQLKPAPFGDKRLTSALLNDGDMLISRANTRELVGLAGLYRDIGVPCSYPDLMMRLIPSTKVSAGFLELLLRSSRTRMQIQALAVGTSESMVKISAPSVCNLIVAVPGKVEQGLITERFTSIRARLECESTQVGLLSAIKAGLMDDLLTGRVRVTPLLT